MGCKRIDSKISLYLDGQLNKGELLRVKNHLEHCKKCSELYNDLARIKEYCKNLSEEEIPPRFYDRLWGRINEKEEVNVFKKRKGLKIFIGLASLIVVLIIGVSALSLLEGGAKKDTAYPSSPGDSYYGEEQWEEDGWGSGYEMEEDTKGDYPEREMADSSSSWRGEGDNSGLESAEAYADKLDRMIIKSADLGVETLDFDSFTGSLEGKIKVMGGYIETSNTQGIPKESRGRSYLRKANYEIRIPSEKFTQFINDVGDLGNLVTKIISGEDVTGRYFDTKARLKSLTVQEDRLLKILEKAEALYDIIELERELSRVRYEIEDYTGTMKSLEQRVKLSRISIDVFEVKELKDEETEPETLWDRIFEAFKSSIKNLGIFFEGFTVFLIAAIPYLTVIALIGWLIWAVKRKISRGKSRKKGEEEKKVI